MALTNKLRKLIKSLDQKKYRKQTGLFVAEGVKIVQDLLKSDFQIEHIFISPSLIEKFNFPFDINVTVVEDSEFEKISLQKTPQKILALVRQKLWEIDIKAIVKKDIVLILDNLQDPGNLGTILRTCDWFGIKAILASQETVDVYNPKVVQASMGAIFRVPIIYDEISKYLADTNVPVYGTFVQGKNIYQVQLQNNGYIVIGNEARGISSAIEKYITYRISIPSFNPKYHIESLNASIATAVIVSEFRRRMFKKKFEKSVIF